MTQEKKMTDHDNTKTTGQTKKRKKRKRRINNFYRELYELGGAADWHEQYWRD